ncbi:hypothetical protein GOP47_0002267 [Adiantum capillus-veneris]|uniref:Uncharacterized protein n=1 Tax=Adiantum capillus-veneris TaxID=13818 RepID=A0A9D4ZP17_ADICA|nr:hypothetical protein GOP47_0002267 [Adiantum capillus-veneris]
MKQAGKRGVGATCKRCGGSARQPSVFAHQTSQEIKSSEYQPETSNDSSNHPPKKKSMAKSTIAPPPHKRVKLSKPQGAPMSSFMHAGKGRCWGVKPNVPRPSVGRPKTNRELTLTIHST